MIKSPLLPISKLLVAFVLSCLMPAALALGQDREQERLSRRSEKITKSLINIQADENSKIPREVMQQAKGIIILKQYEAGVIFGVKGGFGLAIRRDQKGEWGPPAWIKTGELSGGLQIGAHKLNIVLVIVQDEALRKLEKAKFQIGIDASVTRGPTGSTFEAKLGNGADILAYTDYEGLYAGATFEGGYVLPDRRSNEQTYGKRFEVSEILVSEELETPEFLQNLIDILNQIEAQRIEKSVTS